MTKRTQLSRPLAVVANRLPISRADDGTWETSTGGLVTAMRPVVAEVGGAWVGWDGGDRDVPQRVGDLNVDLHPVSLSHAQVQGYYYGFANRTLWPLFHDLLEEPVIERRWWHTYVEVNERMADAAGDAASSTGQSPLYWVQDYHLMLMPEQLRQRQRDADIGFFLHIPWPHPELFARLPWREELLRGLLGADVVGFHTEPYRENFCRAARRLLGVEAEGKLLHLEEGRTVRTAASAISIEVEEFADLATHPDTQRELSDLREQFEGRHVFLGVDRVDYTKGIRHRLQAIELLLERNPELRNRFAFVQIGVPSREDVAEYQSLREEIEREVGRINGRFTEPGRDVPVHYFYRGVSKNRLAAYYRLADVMCVTPLKDGMNLVAKEFAVCQDAGGDAGALLLSEFTGAIRELGADAVPCNPFDVEGLSYLMQACLELEESDRRERIERMAAAVREHDVFHWVDGQLGLLEDAAESAG
ncbi:MAG: trehalose-6-phosphate synthase [Nitriliruptorales bacterium]|nr:trehalose-6-phosphate synthase [Nitriliruptorales bacterium]